MYYRINDPPLTAAGVQQAQQVARTIVNELKGKTLTCIFSSKLLRAVQTAREIALELSVPIILSSGFAKTAQAVESCELFEFLSLSEIMRLCPGVEIIDADMNTEHIEPNVEDNLHNMYLPCDKWHHPIQHVSNNFPLSIVVAHRETIRNLCNHYFKAPYCCYGVFQFPTWSYKDVVLERVMHPHGEILLTQHDIVNPISSTPNNRAKKYCCVE